MNGLVVADTQCTPMSMSNGMLTIIPVLDNCAFSVISRLIDVRKTQSIQKTELDHCVQIVGTILMNTKTSENKRSRKLMLRKKLNLISSSLFAICECDCPDFISIIRTEITDIPRVKIIGIDRARMMFSYKLFYEFS